MAANKSKFFRIAVEGATADRREIKREWITQAAKNYSTQMYGARLNIEHIKSFSPMSANNPFGAYGDVIALSASEIEDGPLKGKMALYAQIDPTDDMVTLSKKRQKIYTSAEFNPDFADTGEAYLVALAATDDPASLGTEALKFAARRSSNVFSDACETSIEFEGEPESSSVLSFVKNLFSSTKTDSDQQHTDVRRAVEEVANFASKQSREVSKLRIELSAAQQEAAAAKKRADDAFTAIEALTAKLSTTDNGAAQRPASTGSTGELVTDC
ncbi:GPO family capsid scaffolding protein [Burkholderia sp. JSH-S8]|nr:GPO family capsid scaffolding protein [Burkholderia sp. JSH-S8]